MRRSSRAFSLIEVLVALGIFGVLVGAWWGVLTMLRRGEGKLTDRACAMASAEVALARLSMDVKSMLPPDPFRAERCPELGGDGRTLAFWRCERARGGIAARRVRFEVKPFHDHLQLLRDGHPIAGVLLSEFSVRLAAGPHGEPRLAVALTGVSGPETHAVELELPLPPPGPGATVGLPAAAGQLVDRAVQM